MVSREKIDEIKSMLPDYLDSQGIDYREKFRCLNPDHKAAKITVLYHGLLQNP